MDGLEDDVEEEKGSADGDMVEKNAEEQWKSTLVEEVVCRAKNEQKNVKNTKRTNYMQWNGSKYGRCMWR